MPVFPAKTFVRLVVSRNGLAQIWCQASHFLKPNLLVQEFPVIQGLTLHNPEHIYE